MATDLTYCGTVSSEVGPIVLIDGAQTSLWPGLDLFLERHPNVTSLPWEEGSAHLVAEDNSRFLLWDIGGAGTVDIFLREQEVVLVRAWTDETDDEAELRLITEIAKQPMPQPTPIGKFALSSGTLCILWAAEEGKNVKPMRETEDPITWLPDPHRLSIDGTGRFVPIPAGIYICFTDVQEGKDWSACRCCLVRD